MPIPTIKHVEGLPDYGTLRVRNGVIEAVNSASATSLPLPQVAPDAPGIPGRIAWDPVQQRPWVDTGTEIAYLFTGAATVEWRATIVRYYFDPVLGDSMSTSIGAFGLHEDTDITQVDTGAMTVTLLKTGIWQLRVQAVLAYATVSSPPYQGEIRVYADGSLIMAVPTSATVSQSSKFVANSRVSRFEAGTVVTASRVDVYPPSPSFDLNISFQIAFLWRPENDL